MEQTEKEIMLEKLYYAEIEKKINKDGIVRQIKQLNNTLNQLTSTLNPKFNNAYEEVVEKILELTRKL